MNTKYHIKMQPLEHSKEIMLASEALEMVSNKTHGTDTMTVPRDNLKVRPQHAAQTYFTLTLLKTLLRN